MTRPLSSKSLAMSLDLEIVGATSQSYAHTYDWRKLATYALGIGATRDELDYLYEHSAGGMKTFPSYAVVPAFEPVFELLATAKTNMAMIVHGGQTVHAYRPLPAEGELQTTGTLKAIYDLKRFSQLVVETESTLDGERIFGTEWSIIVRGAGGFGGPRPPAHKAPKIDKGREPDWTMAQTTSPEQALLYRISGDTNPLHADPAFAKEVGFDDGPILHGLCTYGHVARAVTHRAAGGDANKVTRLTAQFRKPVWPGDTIVTEGFDLGDGIIALRATVSGRPDPVVTNAWAQVNGSEAHQGR